MSSKRDSTPLLPCVPTWVSSTKSQNSTAICPQRLSQLALPNLCIVMAVLRDHYEKLGQKQRQTLQNLIKKIESASKRKYNQTLFEQAKAAIARKMGILSETPKVCPPSGDSLRTKRHSKRKEKPRKRTPSPKLKEKEGSVVFETIYASDQIYQNVDDEDILSFIDKEIIIQSVNFEEGPIEEGRAEEEFVPEECTKDYYVDEEEISYLELLEDIFEEKESEECNFPEKNSKTNNEVKIYDLEIDDYEFLFKNIIDLLLQADENTRIKCIELSTIESEIISYFLGYCCDPKNEFYNAQVPIMVVDPLIEIPNDERNIILIKDLGNRNFSTFIIRFRLFKVQVRKYLVDMNLILERILIWISYERLPKITPPRIMSHFHCKSELLMYKLSGHIDGHPPGTLNYFSLDIYRQWQNQLKDNLQLYDLFKMECQKPIMTSKCFYMFGAYHLWRLYSVHYSRVLRRMTKYFNKKHVTYCEKCFDYKSLREILITHYVPSDLMNAIYWNKFWSSSLQEAVECVKNAQK